MNSWATTMEGGPSKEDVRQMTQEIAQWMETQNFPGRKDDKIITKFLLGTKYRVDVAKKKLKNFYNLRKTYGIWFDNRDPQDVLIQDLLKAGMFIPLTAHGGAEKPVVAVRPVMLSARTYRLDLLLKASLMCLDLVIDQDDHVLERGVHVLFDCRGASLAYMTQITPKHLWLLVQMWQNIYPIRIKSVHIFNCPTFVNILVTIAKSFMTEKLKKRVHNHGNNHLALLKNFDSRILPEEYGGSCGPMSALIDTWRTNVDANRGRIICGDLFCG